MATPLLTLLLTYRSYRPLIPQVVHQPRTPSNPIRLLPFSIRRVCSRTLGARTEQQENGMPKSGKAHPRQAQRVHLRGKKRGFSFSFFSGFPLTLHEVIVLTLVCSKSVCGARLLHEGRTVSFSTRFSRVLFDEYCLPDTRHDRRPCDHGPRRLKLVPHALPLP